ncbi:MAG: chromate transporter [Candidatus Moranbacteria bacterium]|nr:chromate transporter [Candidatus Moranbacteria bacterium]NTW46004.1 chromate transporter [Candidatus Moranbacteria bacterium]
MSEETKTEEKKTEGTASSDMKGVLAQLEAILDEYMVKKAPFAIPQNGKDLIVKVAPYLVIVMAIIAVPALLAGLGLSALLAPFALLGGHYGVAAFISFVFAAISLVLDLLAIPGLFARSARGWRLSYYATLVGLVGNILSFNVIGGLVGAIIGWYILFQVKDMYTN